jgi:ATP-binding cassette subfamily F protein 3
MRRATQIEQRVEQILTKESIDKPARVWQMKMDFEDVPSSGRMVVAMENLAAGYGEQVLFKELNLAVRFGQRVAIVGPNGAGKTTLLRTIAGTIPPLAGQVRYGANVRAGLMTQENDHLDSDKTVLETMQDVLTKPETEVRAFLSLYLFQGDAVFTPVGLLSYGERARLSLACLVAQGCNLLLLDEPINHLDIPSRARFEQALQAFEGTCITVVHDRYFIQGYASEIWEFSNGQVWVNPRVS